MGLLIKFPLFLAILFLIMIKIYKNKAKLIEELVKSTDVVLDVGFWGQGVNVNSSNWVHNLLKKCAKDVYGLDINFDSPKFLSPEKYKKGNAENFDFNTEFDVIFAGDLIEHLSNPGLFLLSCARNLKKGGRLIITTPNCFNLFHLAEKIVKSEPTVNPDHICYFNYKTLKQLLIKNGWEPVETGFLYSLDVDYRESYKKKFLNVLYYIISKLTPKFMETLMVVAKKI